MSTTENNLATEPTAEELQPQGLSIDQPPSGQGPLPNMDYDGAAPSEPAAEVTTKAGKKLLRMDLGDGNVYTGETERELLQKVADGKREANRTIKELKERAATPPPQQQQSVTPEPRRAQKHNYDLPDGYDHQTYLDMMAVDPKKAALYMNRELYGEDLDPARLRHSYTVANQVQQQLVVTEFMRRNPEYVPSAESADALSAVMKENRLPTDSLVNFEWAFREAQRTGKIRTASTTNDGDIEYEDIVFNAPPNNPAPAPVRQAPQSRGGGAPANARGGVGSGYVPANEDAYEIPLDQLRRKIEEGGKRLR